MNCLNRICVLSKVKEKYTFEKKIGSGSFGKVYLGTRLTNEKKYAIKTINKKGLLSDIKNIECLLKEIELMRLLKHPNIVKLYEVYESSTHIYLVLEYIEGENLLLHLRSKGTYSEKDAAHIVMQALDILDYCHSKNVIHRDIKPENLMISYS